MEHENLSTELLIGFTKKNLDAAMAFRWSPDSKMIAFWQVDATKVRDYYMLNTTDSVYSRVIPVEYPKVGEPPSPVRIGIVNVENNRYQMDGCPRRSATTLYSQNGMGG